MTDQVNYNEAGIPIKYKDSGDGTFAEVVSATATLDATGLATDFSKGSGVVDSTTTRITPASNSTFNIEFDQTHTSAFNDLLIAKLEPLIQLTFIHGINNQTGSIGTPLNSATGDTLNSRLRLQSGTNSAGAVAFIGKKPVVYRAAEGIIARFTALFDSGIANNMRLVGLAGFTPSASNTAFTDFYGVGFYVGTDSTSTVYDGTTFGFLHRNSASGSVVDRFYPLSQWIDPLNGSGFSAQTLDVTKGNLFAIKYPFQGFGNIRLEWQNPANGEYITVLVVQYANTNTHVQLRNPNLVPYILNINSGSTTNKAVYVGSYGIFLTGERRYLGAFFGARNAKTGTTAGVNVLSLKTATTYNGEIFRGLIKLRSVSVAWDNNNDVCHFEIIKNATSLGGTPAFTGRDGTITADTGATTIAGAATITGGNSVVAIDTAGTTISGGTVVFNSTLARNSNHFLDVFDLDLFLGGGESFTFATFGGSAGGTVSIAVNWTELTG